MKVLLVDDDEIFAEGVKAGLAKEGFAVDILNDSAKAKTRLSDHRDTYDIFIFDMMMPETSGVELCKFVRSEDIKTPILMLSGITDPLDKAMALNAGADDYITKPFSLVELCARLQALLRRPKEVKESKVMIGNITLDSINHIVKKGGKNVELTLKEFSLLEYFMRHPNQVLLRDQILDHVWDFNFSSFSNVIDVHINSLRKKLKMGSKGMIETIRGVGYRLNN